MGASPADSGLPVVGGLRRSVTVACGIDVGLQPCAFERSKANRSQIDWASPLAAPPHLAQVGCSGLAGVLPGLGSSMIRGPYACRLLGQASPLPAMCPSGPLVLLDAGPEPGRWVKPWSRPSHPRPCISPLMGAGGRRRRSPGDVGMEGQRCRRPAGAAALCAAPLISASDSIAVQEAGKADASSVNCGVLPSFHRGARCWSPPCSCCLPRPVSMVWAEVRRL